MSTVVQKAYTLKLAAADIDTSNRGTFTGTALVYGEKDSFGDSIRENAFSKSISDAGGRFPLLWTHDAREVLGTINVDGDGRTLAVTGSMLTDVVPKAREIHGLLKARAIKGLSVGFLPLRAAPIDGGGTEFVEGRLLEISLCAVPAYQSAMVNEVRSLEQLVQSLDARHDREALLAVRRSIDAILGDPPPDRTRELVSAFGTFDARRWKR
jgi:HK97 family phage prohead protease